MPSLTPITHAQVSLPTRTDKPVHFNTSLLTAIPSSLRHWSSKRVILVASAGLARNTDTISKLQSSLGSTLAATKLGIRPHTPYADVLDVLRLIREHDADALVCIGSSSYSDCCKIARLLHYTLPADAELTVESMEALVDHATGRTLSIPGSSDTDTKDLTLKLILCPTTLSASEYNAVSSASNPKGKKQHFGTFEPRHDIYAPDVMICDPWVAATTPRDVWIMSGIRAVDHCVETFGSKGFSREGKETVLKGLRALVKGLWEYRRGEEEGEGVKKGDVGDVEGKAKEKEQEDKDVLIHGISSCQRGARDAISGLVVHRSTMGPSHAIGHQLGSVGGVPHGLTSCIMLAPVLRYEKAHPDSKWWDVSAQAEIVDVFNEVLGWKETEAGDAVQRFVREMGMKTRLGEVGVEGEEMLGRIAECTMTDVWGGGECQLDGPEQVREILEMVR